MHVRQETAAFGYEHALRNTAIIPTWAANGIRPTIPAAVTVQEQAWEKTIGHCWQTDPDKRPSFRQLSRQALFCESNSDDGWQQRREDSKAATVAVGMEPELPARPPQSSAVSSATAIDLYASETEVSSWLKTAGLGHRVAIAAASDEDFCELEAFESIALSGGAEAEAAKAEFVERMELTDGEEELFVLALEQLKLNLLETRDGQDEKRPVRPPSPSSSSTATGVSRPASPPSLASMPEFGGAE